MAAYEDKKNLLLETTGNRVILIGGSNLAFGIDSELLQRETGRNVINLGLHVDLGLKYMLDDIEDHLKSNDIVLIIPEYENFNERIFSGGELLSETILTKNINGLKKLNYTQLKSLLIYSPRIIFYSIYKYLFISNDEDNYSPPYRRDNFNSYGDVTGHLDMANEKITISRLNLDHTDKTIKYINEFNRETVSRNVKTYFIYPSYQHAAYELNREKVEKLDDQLKSQIKIKILGDVNDFVFSDDLFFDTYYHLNKKGRELRTNILIDLLNENEGI